MKFNRLVSSDYIKIIPILAFASFMAFIPHLTYPYAVHIDEWVHIAYSNALLDSGTVYSANPFSGQGSGGIVALLESGYHIPLAIFQRFSGVPWVDIARYAPSITFIFTVLSVYIFAKKIGFGWEAAFFTCFITTTVGILGPAFIVPVAMGLLFVPLLLFLITDFQTKWAYPVICLFISFLIILHATSAILVMLILLPFCLFNWRANPKHNLAVLAAVIFPFLFTLPWTSGLILSQWGSLFVPKPLPAYHSFLKIIPEYGFLPTTFCLIGVFILIIGGNWKSYSLVISLTVLLTMLAVFYTLHYGIDALYLRGLLYAMLMMGIVAGAGLRELWKLELPWINAIRLKKPHIMQVVSILLCLIVVSATLIIAIPSRQFTPYYHMIDKTDYEAFIWIKNNTDTSHQKAILDPWKATAFTAITDKYVYTRIHTSPQPIDSQTYDFLEGGCKDTAFLLENGISLIYTRIADIVFTPDNPDLVEIRENVFLLKPAITDR
ncbi:MAG: hypothetical protein PHQ86_08115 [Dehalococcoidales bacterium]|nr:hypothetical protein [Dehalococcoidales bacterium]